MFVVQGHKGSGILKLQSDVFVGNKPNIQSSIYNAFIDKVDAFAEY